MFTVVFFLLALPHASHLYSSWRWYHLICLASIQHLLFSTLRPLPWKCKKKDSFFLMICASWFECLIYDFIPAQFTFWVAVFLSNHPERKMDTDTYETQFGWMHFLTSVLCSSLGLSPQSASLHTPFHAATPWGWVSLFTSSLSRLCCIELTVSLLQFVSCSYQWFACIWRAERMVSTSPNNLWAQLHF